MKKKKSRPQRYILEKFEKRKERKKYDPLFESEIEKRLFSVINTQQNKLNHFMKKICFSHKI